MRGAIATNRGDDDAPARQRLGGFPSEAFRFYELLGAENTKAFWTQHKREYDEFVKAPFEALAAAVASEFGLPGAAAPALRRSRTK